MPEQARSPSPTGSTAVSTPNAAAAESRLVIAACSGISSERNATISSRKPSRMTVPITRSSRAEISEARSTYDAV